MSTVGKAKFTYLHCSLCGRRIGKKPGVQVILGLVCDDPICNYQDAAMSTQQRDAYIICAALESVSVTQIALATGITRQRVYQILDTWKRAV